jgi:hypothetical protein
VDLSSDKLLMMMMIVKLEVRLKFIGWAVLLVQCKALSKEFKELHKMRDLISPLRCSSRFKSPTRNALSIGK